MSFSKYSGIAGSGIPIYPSAVNFPVTGTDGQQAVAADTNTIYIYDTTVPAWVPVATPGAAIAIDALTDDVSATGPGVVAATVNKVGGKSATDIANAVTDVQNATASATASTIAKRDLNADCAFHVLKVAAGTAAAPSFTFTGNTATGVYSSAANVLNLSTNGVSRMSVSATGLVNIAGLTASQIVATDASSNLQTLDTATYPSLIELSYVKGVTSSIQTQLNGKQPVGNYANTNLSNLAAPTAINQSLLFNPDNSFDIGADGASRPAAIHAANHVTAPLVRARDNVPGAGQHDITVRAGNGTTGNKNGGDLTLAGGTPSGTGTPGHIYLKTNNVTAIDLNDTGTVNFPLLTASQILALDGSKNLQSLSTATYPSLTELSYVKGVTSAIQTQLNNKQPFAKVDRITKSINYNVSSSDDYIGCDTSVASLTLSLPAANTVANGKKVIIKDEGGNAGAIGFSIFIAPSGTDKIDGSNATLSLDVGYESLTLVCNGADAWFII